MLGSKCLRGGINVGLFVAGKGMVDFCMWFSHFYGGEVDSNIWSGMYIPEIIECRFDVFRTGVVVV